MAAEHAHSFVGVVFCGQAISISDGPDRQVFFNYQVFSEQLQCKVIIIFMSP